MKKFKNHQRPRRKYRFYIVGHKKALKIWWDSPFNVTWADPQVDVQDRRIEKDLV
jgi:hypothetical protein